MARGEARMAGVNCDARIVAQAALDAACRETQNIILARFHVLHIDADRSDNLNAELAGTAGKVRRVGAGDERFGRSAASIDASAAEAVALDDRHFLACARELMRECRTGLACANDNGIVLRHVRLQSLP